MAETAKKIDSTSERDSLDESFFRLEKMADAPEESSSRLTAAECDTYDTWRNETTEPKPLAKVRTGFDNPRYRCDRLTLVPRLSRCSDPDQIKEMLDKLTDDSEVRLIDGKSVEGVPTKLLNHALKPDELHEILQAADLAHRKGESGLLIREVLARVDEHETVVRLDTVREELNPSSIDTTSAA